MKKKCMKLIESSDVEYGLSNVDRRIAAIEIMLTSLEEHRSEFSPDVFDALKLARIFHSRRSTLDELLEVRVNMWKLISGRDCQFDDPFVCKIRAVICVLFPINEMEDAGENLWNYFEFYQGAKLNECIALEAIKQVYSNYGNS